ncbi:hypothetical protein [Bacteroides sp. 14(A)]|uniref:hypothetical protein n=1 Tax=Bacteroides sp. 14(A) TaxID=1163670 RepID=UPI0004B0EE9A|nr:hypothetical protein [Bacteroides sp. 14(A)]
MVRFEPEEYVKGIAGQVLTEQEAAKLIEAGGNKIGEEVQNENNSELPAEDFLCRFRTVIKNLWRKITQLTERRYRMSDVAGSFLYRYDY